MSNEVISNSEPSGSEKLPDSPSPLDSASPFKKQDVKGDGRGALAQLNLSAPMLAAQPSIPKLSGPVKLLSLDGGGYRGLALLLQLRQIMRNIPGIDISKKLYPCRYFDLIGGTSTGGLVALMLGRLGMDIESAIEKYKTLGPIVFGKDHGAFLGMVVRGAHFDAAPFERELTSWLGEQPMHDSDLDSHCRCFVTTAPGNLASVVTPTILRSYPDPPRTAMSPHTWLVKDAARATSAAPTYFPPLDVGDGFTFKDAGAFGFNNPTLLLIREAEIIQEFKGRAIGSILSLGTGLSSLARPVGPPTFGSTMESDTREQNLVNRTLQKASALLQTPKDASDRLKQLKDDLVAVATNTEVTHHSVYWSLRERTPKVSYVRLNPPAGLDSIDLADVARGADIITITNQYLEVPEISDQIEQVASTLADSSEQTPFQPIAAPSLPQQVLQSLQKDSALNSLTMDATKGVSVVLPIFSKQLSDVGLIIQPPPTERPASCAFDLAHSLGLLDGQINAGSAPRESVSEKNLVHNGSTYFACISRHFLVLLISEHVQEVWQQGDKTLISTDMGQFTLYEDSGRSLVHFDASRRTSSYPTIPNQKLDDVQAAAKKLDYDMQTGQHWQGTPKLRELCFSLEHIPPVTRFMRPRETQEWYFIMAFTEVIGDVVESILRSVSSPESFATAMRINWLEKVGATGIPDHVTEAEYLASLLQVCLILLRGNKVGDFDRETQNTFSGGLLNTSRDAHEVFRGAPVDKITFITRSNERFMQLFTSYRTPQDKGHIRDELLKLLNRRPENVALVAVQVAFAVFVKRNAVLVLSQAKEAPEEWIRVVLAEDGDMFIG